jgi:drug/metabolite transporter (DMT)-like permease
LFLFVCDVKTSIFLSVFSMSIFIFGSQGIVASAINFTIMAWANQRVGPSTVALYLPIQPLAASVLSTVFLGTPIFLGRCTLIL